MAKNKIKTHKGTAKRIWKTKSGKLRRRSAAQAHFNARASRDHIRQVRTDTGVAKADELRVNEALPYQK